MRKMGLEQMDHVLRHVEMHANEFRHGNFTKGGDYLKKLKEAQELALEVSHDIIHVMRTKQFKGYENADFSYDIILPNDYKHHQFRHFDAASFRVGCKLKATMDLDIVPDSMIQLSCEEAEQQMNELGWAIQDAEVFIKILEEYFNKPQVAYRQMELEQADHFLRHIKMHAEELENGTFAKASSYLEKLKIAQYKGKDLAHDLFHVMREKGYDGYKDNDFDPYVPLPADYKQNHYHEFRRFDYDSFKEAIKIKYILDLGMVMERDIPLSEEEGNEQMAVLKAAIEDAEVFITTLEEYFKDK